MRHPAHRPTLRTPAAIVALLACTTPVVAGVTFYANEGFDGRSYTTSTPVGNLLRHGFNDRASSVVVSVDHWQVCADADFGGRCMVLRPGQYPALTAMGMEDRISSARAVPRQARFDKRHYAPAPRVAQDYRRREHERLFEAPVTAVRAVVATTGQRCWIERENLGLPPADHRVPGAVLGTAIGGILGHQVGGDSGPQDAAAGGAAVGPMPARDRGGPVSGARDLQRCAAPLGGARPEYWDVSYRFRRQDHTVQLTRPPGATVTVNHRGEPRA